MGVTRSILLAVLMACGTSPALDPPPVAPAEAPKTPPPAPPAATDGDDDFSFQVGTDGGDPNLTDERHPRTCELRTARLAEVQREIAVVEREHEQYVAAHCKQTMKQQHDSLRGTSWGPERAWICDGKLVDIPKSPRLEYLLTREANLRDYVRMHCQ